MENVLRLERTMNDLKTQVNELSKQNKAMDRQNWILFFVLFMAFVVSALQIHVSTTRTTPEWCTAYLNVDDQFVM